MNWVAKLTREFTTLFHRLSIDPASEQRQPAPIRISLYHQLQFLLRFRRSRVIMHQTTNRSNLPYTVALTFNLGSGTRDTLRTRSRAHEASLFYSFYSQSIIASLSSLSLSFICRQLRRSSLTAHVASPPKISHCAACLSLPFRSSVVATRGRPCSVRRKRVHALPHLPLRLSFLSSPPVTDTTRYQRRVTWFFPPDQSFNSVPRSFTAFFSTSVVALRPPSVRK